EANSNFNKIAKQSSNLASNTLLVDSLITVRAELWKSSWEEFNALIEVSIDTFSISEQLLADSNLDMYVNYLYPSPDSSKCLDIFTYNMNLEVVDGDTIATFLVDSEASLVNLKTKYKSRILYYGSAGGFDYAFWINPEKFIICGYEEGSENEIEGYYPTVWYFNLSNSIVKKYHANLNRRFNSTFLSKAYPSLTVK
ncbi:hypothetical protein, partial [Fulvivirga kasyanovii]|uniref:hypothetical protein n=1 Tax=Fulvivirga kasyanovii TaxID=396812 RepID=UPI0031DD4214